MLIQDMTPKASVQLLEASRIGRIACARGAQPYVTVFSFAYHEEAIYSFATVGQKIEWMRTNPLVCVEVSNIVSAQEWQSVVVFGRYQELPDSPTFCDARTRAHDLLAQTASWWEPGYVRTVHNGAERPLVPLYFRISIDTITGHEGIPDAPKPPAHKTLVMP